MDKKGIELATNAIVITIIALVLLILLITFLTGGFKGFKEKISIYLSSSNVDDIKTSCNQLALQDSKFEYCCVNKTVKLSGTQKMELTCFQATNQTWGIEITKLECSGVC